MDEIVADCGIILVEMQTNYRCARLEVTPTCFYLGKTCEKPLSFIQVMATIFINK